MKKISFVVSLLILFFSNFLFAQNKIEFKQLSKMVYDRFGMGYCSDGNYIYAVAGGTGGPPDILRNVERYDPSSDKWEIIIEGLMPRRYCNAEYVPSENKIYIFNGEYFTTSSNILTKYVEVIDLNTNTVTAGPDNPYPVRNAGSAVWDNKIYFFGGQNHYGVTNAFYEFDPAKGVWKQLPDLPHSRQTSGKIVDGILYVFGGFDGVQRLKRVDAYNIKEGKWTRLEDLPFRISAHSTATDGKNIWLVGSYEDLDYLAMFNTETKKLTIYDSNMTRRRNAGSVALGGKLFIFGGNQNARTISALNNVEIAKISDFQQ